MTSTHVKGSCLCGAIQYSVQGEVIRFYHCHCQRCRKATGTGHASNLFMEPESALHWEKGEDMLQRYNVPEAKRFYNLFCRKCGSSMPRQVPELDAVIIPAGTLDTEPGMVPNGHIFWASRASWSCPESGLPVYAEYPES